MTTHQHTHTHDHHDGLAEMLDLDAEVFAGQLRDVHADIERAADAPIGSILDVGAGTGTGTFGLLRFFADAHAIAVDASADMLAHLEQHAAQLGLADRVTTTQADLDAAVPEVGPIDLVWASASLHHLADPDHTLSRLAATLRPGGLLTVLELDGMPHFVPAGTPGADAEARAHALLAADRAVGLPAMGSDWGSRLERAGLVVEQHRTITLDPRAAASEAIGRYAAATLDRIRAVVRDRLDEPDRLALDALLAGGQDDVRARGDISARGERQLWIARRPG